MGATQWVHGGKKVVVGVTWGQVEAGLTSERRVLTPPGEAEAPHPIALIVKSILPRLI